jgi:AraC-like DNA-binding protein
MIAVCCLDPDPRLAGLVHAYQARQGNLGATNVRVPLPARPDLTLDFYFTCSNLVEERRTGTRYSPPTAVVVGPHTHRRIDVLISGRVDIFTVRFAPTGLHTLFGIAMPELVDTAFGAESLFGSAIAGELYERMAAERTTARRVNIIEAQLLSRLQSPRYNPIAAAATALQSSSGGARIEGLATSFGLSTRHFSRLFREHVGMSPKTYARILRLQAAIAAKAATPNVTWSEVAYQAGYFDQAHLDKDFLDLADASPSDFMQGL